MAVKGDGKDKNSMFDTAKYLPSALFVNVDRVSITSSVIDFVENILEELA